MNNNKICKTQGEKGEDELVTLLEKIPNVKIVRNIYIKNKKGIPVTEIDVIMLHSSGMYVFEMKNYSGQIYNSPLRKKYWYQTCGKNVKPRKFYSPIEQNVGHIKHMISHMNWNCMIQNIPILSYIVFGKKSYLQAQCNNEYLKVLCIQNVMTSLYYTMSKRKSILSSSQIDVLYNDLKQCTKVSQSEKAAHISYVKKKGKVK